MPSVPQARRLDTVVVASTLALLVIGFPLFVVYTMVPRSMRTSSLTIAEAKEAGTFVARVVHVSGPGGVGPESMVERSWRFKGRFPFAEERVSEPGFRTKVELNSPLPEDAYPKLFLTDDLESVPADTSYIASCCALGTAFRPVSGMILLWRDDPARRDTIRLRIDP